MYTIWRRTTKQWYLAEYSQEKMSIWWEDPCEEHLNSDFWKLGKIPTGDWKLGE